MFWKCTADIYVQLYICDVPNIYLYHISHKVYLNMAKFILSSGKNYCTY